MIILSAASFNRADLFTARFCAKAVAQILYDFVSADSFGWKAWLEAHERHVKKVLERTDDLRQKTEDHP